MKIFAPPISWPWEIDGLIVPPGIVHYLLTGHLITASPVKEQLIVKKRESVKLKESADGVKSQWAINQSLQRRLALLAIDI